MPDPLLESTLEKAFQAGLAHHQAGRLAPAHEHYQRILAADPRHADAWHLSGVVAYQRGQFENAAASIRKALALKPATPEYHSNLGNALRNLGRPAEAEACYREALRLKPDYVEAHSNLGNALRDLGRLEEAAAACRLALRFKPDFHLAHANLGSVLLDSGRTHEAVACFRETLRLRPDCAEAHSGLGNAIRLLGRLAEAEACHREALRLNPDLALGHNNLGITLLDGGRPAEAAECFRQALRLKPDYAIAHSNLIFALDLVPGAGAAAQQAERRRWYERHGQAHATSVTKHADIPDPERALRIGYVSADFRRQSAAYSFAGVLRRHDRDRFQVFCYSNAPPHHDDDVTRLLRAGTQGWRVIFGMEDGDVAAQIRADRIDILVDLSGHMRGERLLVFARKPAPVQISAWGNATGTGLATMDYLFADPIAIPTGIRPQFAETIIDLPCLAPFEALDELPAAAGPLPRATTFGCFNRLAKMTSPTLDLFARILAALPATRLLLKGNFLDDAGIQGRLRTALTARGIEGERATFLGATSYREHLAAYTGVDIALDPVPHGGGMSTCDALLMGVPVLTLCGSTVVGRVSSSILTALELTDWIARDEDEYVAIAVRKAQNAAGLRRLRGELRHRLATSVVGDLESYTRATETAYRAVWRRRCQQQSHDA